VQLVGESAPLSSKLAPMIMSKVLTHSRGGGRLFLLVVLLDALEELEVVLATSSSLGNVY
jgi:hypothetical protein